jgi:5-methylcytosine-specific restriction endonuclease McrA
MRPIAKGLSSPLYGSHTTFSFDGATAPIVQKVLRLPSAVNVPISDCLDAWLRQVKGDKPLGGTRADQDKAVKTIQNHVAALYKLASVPLTQEFGAFCSFCETPLPGLLEVEHCVPKSEYPIFATEWKNFLLACNPCNSAKRNAPSRSMAQGWLGALAPSEQDYYDEIRLKHYVWPDMVNDSYSWHPVALQCYEDASSSWKALALDRAMHLDNYIVSSDVVTREVKARIYDPSDPQPGRHNDYLVRVVVGVAGDTVRADEMIKVCKLNEQGNVASTYDRRMFNRTQTWFRCLFALKTLFQVSGAGTKDAVWKLLVQSSVGTGFYSVWLTVIRFHDPKLAHDFVRDTDQQGYYSGTDRAKLP